MNKEGLPASYKISKIIAQTGNSHTIGTTVILPSLRVVFNKFNIGNINELNTITLSATSVSRRIDEMVDNIESSLIDYLKGQKFALQLDECTLQGNESLVLAYVRLFTAMTL